MEAIRLTQHQLRQIIEEALGDNASPAMRRAAAKRDDRKSAERAMRKKAKQMSKKDRRAVLGVKEAALDEGGPGSISFTDELFEFVITAIDDLIPNYDSVGKRAAEAATNRLKDKVPVPVRYEDVEPIAEGIADAVMSNQRMHNIVQNIARTMLTELMEPV